jgi:hypothetical protein
MTQRDAEIAGAAAEGEIDPNGEAARGSDFDSDAFPVDAYVGRSACRRGIRLPGVAIRGTRNLARVLALAVAVFAVAGMAAAAASPTYQAIVERDAPFAYWQLSEAFGARTAADSSGNGHSGTYAGCVKLGQGGPFGGYGATAALMGQHTGCYMTYTPSTGYYGSYTVEAWVNPSTTTKYYQTFFDTRAAGPDPGTEYSSDFKLMGTSDPDGQQLCADVGDGSEWLTNGCTPFAFYAHTWYYVALTVSETGIVTYFIDGVAVYREDLPNYGGAPLLTDPNHPIVVGGNPKFVQSPDTENFEGTIGQVAVYEYALSSTQVAAHYAAGRQPVSTAGGVQVSAVRAAQNGSTTFEVRVPARGEIDVMETAWLDNLPKGYGPAVRLAAGPLQPAAGRFVLGRLHVTADYAETVRLTVVPNATGFLLVEHHRYPIPLRLWVRYEPVAGPTQTVGFYGLHLDGSCPAVTVAHPGRTTVDCIRP